jgi:hypothetical protein
MAYKIRRGKCPYCGHRKALTKDGKLWSHEDNGERCPGSGQRPA